MRLPLRPAAFLPPVVAKPDASKPEAEFKRHGATFAGSMAKFGGRSRGGSPCRTALGPATPYPAESMARTTGGEMAGLPQRVWLGES